MQRCLITSSWLVLAGVASAFASPSTQNPALVDEVLMDFAPQASTTPMADEFSQGSIDSPPPILLTQTRRYQRLRWRRPLRNYYPRYRSRAPYTYRSPGRTYAPGAYYRSYGAGFGRYYNGFGGWNRGGVSIGPLSVWW